MFVTVLAALSCQPSLSAYWLGAKAGGGLLILSGAQCVAFKGICELIMFFFFFDDPGKWIHSCLTTCNAGSLVLLSYHIFLNERWG